jgi:AcrR family transcriptional regulator
MAKAPVELLQSYRRDQILAAAREVIGERGYAGSSVDRIARRAGLSRSTVYEYFSSKEDVLCGCVADDRDRVAADLGRLTRRGGGVESQLAGFFGICLARVDRDREFFRAIVFPLPGDGAGAPEGPGGAELARVVKDFDDALGAILDAGHARGELARPVTPADRDRLGTLITGAMAARSRLETPPPVADASAGFASFALRGLGLTAP